MGPKDIVNLLGFEPSSIPRIRKVPEWRAVLDEIDEQPLDPEMDEAFAEDAKTLEDRHDVFYVLTGAEPSTPLGVETLVKEAMRPDGRFIAPLVLLAGQLQFPFDEVEALKALVAAVTPLAATDPRLREVIDAVGEMLKGPFLQSSTGAARQMTLRIKDALASGRSTISQGTIDAHVERMLLEQRRYQRRSVFGDQRIRALLHLDRAPRPMPAYLPERLVTELPLFERFKVRMIAEVHLQQDQSESHANALRVLALGRVVPGLRRN